MVLSVGDDAGDTVTAATVSRVALCFFPPPERYIDGYKISIVTRNAINVIDICTNSDRTLEGLETSLHRQQHDPIDKDSWRPLEKI